jgi:hypothetical protein
LRLNLVGKSANRDAIGAEIEVRNQRWFVSPTHGYLSQSERTATFGGVGENEKVVVRWRNGKVQEWNLSAGSTHELIEGEPAAK